MNGDESTTTARLVKRNGSAVHPPPVAIVRGNASDFEQAAAAMRALDAGADPASVKLPTGAVLSPTPGQIAQFGQELRPLGIEVPAKIPKNGWRSAPLMSAPERKVPAHLFKPGMELAVVSAIMTGLFDEVPERALIPEAAFTDSRWRIIYRAGLALRADPNGACGVEAVNDYIAMNQLDAAMQDATDSCKIISWQTWPKAVVRESMPPSAEDSEDRKGLPLPPSEQCTSVRALEYYLQELGVAYQERQGILIGDRLSSGELNLEQAMSEGAKILHGRNGDGSRELPSLDSADQFCAEPDDTPPELIAGILHQGSKAQIGGGSKAFKTWTLLHLAACVASGAPWLDFPTYKGRVLYLNFELPRFSIRKRINKICEAMEIETPGNLKLLNLRGYGTDAAVILPRVLQEVRQNEFVLIIIDPLYKILGDREENASKDMANLMLAIERLAVDANAAVAFGAHFSKGNQSLKEAIDRISGSGVLSRDPDTIVTMTQHEEKNAYSVDMILRNFEPQDAFVVQWEPPLMVRASALDPAKIKKPKTGRTAEYSLHQILEVLRDRSSLTTTDWSKACEEETGMKPTAFYELKKQAVNEKKVFRSELDKKWCLRA